LLELPLKKYVPTFPFTTRKETELKLEKRKELMYEVTTRGLMPWTGSQKNIRNGLRRGLRFPAQDFGWHTSSLDGPRATRELSNMLKLCGAQPACEHDTSDLLAFRFWFDVSSERNAAYCELMTGQLVEQPLQKFYLAVLCEHVDGTVRGNIRKIDLALTMLAKRCGIPTHPWRGRSGD